MRTIRHPHQEEIVNSFSSKEQFQVTEGEQAADWKTLLVAPRILRTYPPANCQS